MNTVVPASSEYAELWSDEGVDEKLGMGSIKK